MLIFPIVRTAWTVVCSGLAGGSWSESYSCSRPSNSYEGQGRALQYRHRSLESREKGVALASAFTTSGHRLCMCHRRRRTAQESSSKQDPGSRENPPRGDGVSVPSSSARRLPDALKFANGLLRQKKYDLAAEEYERFTRSGAKGKDLDDAQFGLANARLYQGNFREARQAFDEFLKAAPEDPRRLTARYRLGELAYLLGDLPAARQSLEQFRAATSDHAGLEMALTYLGDTYFSLQDFTKARAAYQQSLVAYPQGRLAERAKYGLARSLAALGERDRALALMRELIKQGNPEWIDRAWLQIGLMRKSAGQLGEAVEAFTMLERAAPGARSGRKLNCNALALVRLERHAEAEPLLRSLATEGGASQGARAALELATFELERNHPDEAMATLELGLKRFSGSPLAPALRFRVAEVLEKQNHLEEAQSRFEGMAESAPNDPWADDALERAAQVALNRGDLAGARRLANALAVRFPRSELKPEVRLIEARAAAQQGKHDEAVVVLKSLIAPPADADTTKKPATALPPALIQAARYELALSYRALGQSTLADPILAGLAKEGSGPVAADAQFLLGQSQLTAGRHADAVPMLEAYLAANPRGDVADVALAHLVVARLGLGELESAWKTLATLAERFPQSRSLAPTRLRVAEAALAAHQAERAAEQFRLVAGHGKRPVDPARPAGTKADETTDPAIRARRWPAWESRCASWASRPTRPRPLPPCSSSLLPTRSRPRSPSPGPARSKPTNRSMPQSKHTLSSWRNSRNRTRGRKPPCITLDSCPRPVEAKSRPRAFERLADDPHARDSLQSAGITPDAVLSEWGWVLVDADKQAEADRVFSRLLKDFPNSPHAADARFNLAESANLAHNYTEVVRLLTPLIAARAG